jgi:ribonuclease BN (tRNA processing enzyme)
MSDSSSLCFSIDVLSDGSEYNGNTATLFLSLWKSSNTASDTAGICQDDASLLARYAVAGCPCDVLSRAAADQRFKLGNVHAVFGCDPVNTLAEVSALPGLLYASHRATLTVAVLSDADRIERLVQTIHGSHVHPTVRICQLPSDDDSARAPQWWNVYEDCHIVVHARRWFGRRLAPVKMHQDRNSTTVDAISLKGPFTKRQRQGSFNGIDLTCVVYLYTIRRLVAKCDSSTSCCNNSILMIPEVAPPEVLDDMDAICLELPIVASAAANGLDCAASILARLVIQSRRAPKECNSVMPDFDIPTFVLETNNTANVDPGLLVRAQQQTRAWRDQCAATASLLQHFPFQASATPMDSDTIKQQVNHRAKIALLTGKSVLFIVHMDKKLKNMTVAHVSCLDRNRLREEIGRKHSQCDSGSCTNDNQQNGSGDRASWPLHLQQFLAFRDDMDRDDALLPSCTDDVNEIVLDDCTNETASDHRIERADGTVERSPHLLILGTGCASPSPYRGASGYALIFPINEEHAMSGAMRRLSEVVIAVDVGEGYCTQWNRYALGRPFSSISLIWISHAHWDHFGGLVNLLIQIACDTDKRCGKQPKPGNIPYVVATSKVLSYLTVMFGKNSQYFQAISIDDPAGMSQAIADVNLHLLTPIAFWENVKVDHSCATYGFILGLRRAIIHQHPFTFCYSGDTRPCWRLVQTFWQLSGRHSSDGRMDLLLHEATYDESETVMSIAKKHSTVLEAIRVGRDMDTRRLVLTHFSQRYSTIPSVAMEVSKDGRRMQVAVALDGMMVSLFSTR